MNYHYYQHNEDKQLIVRSTPKEWPADSVEFTRLTTKKGAQLYEATAQAQLLKVLKPGDTVYTVLRHVSSSGMSRRIDLYIIGRDHKPHYISSLASRAMGYKVHKEGGIIARGCGMDMGFALVYELGATLWPNGTKKPHGTRNGQPDRDGGYALKHEWL